MAVLYARVGGAWVPVGGGSDEVHIGPTEPTDSAVELWYDTDAVPAVDPAKMPRGWVGRTVRNTSVNGVGATETDILLVTFATTLGRRYRVGWDMQLYVNGASAVYVKITDASNVTLQNWNYTAPSAGWLNPGSGSFIYDFGTASALTLKLRLACPSSTVNAAASPELQLWVEDIGGL
jgi:hypothetical protein